MVGTMHHEMRSSTIEHPISGTWETPAAFAALPFGPYSPTTKKSSPRQRSSMSVGIRRGSRQLFKTCCTQRAHCTMLPELQACSKRNTCTPSDMTKAAMPYASHFGAALGYWSASAAASRRAFRYKSIDLSHARLLIDLSAASGRATRQRLTTSRKGLSTMSKDKKRFSIRMRHTSSSSFGIVPSRGR